jgi:hypothetical protein
MLLQNDSNADAAAATFILHLETITGCHSQEQQREITSTPDALKEDVSGLWSILPTWKTRSYNPGKPAHKYNLYYNGSTLFHLILHLLPSSQTNDGRYWKIVRWVYGANQFVFAGKLRG